MEAVDARVAVVVVVVMVSASAIGADRVAVVY